MMPLPHEHCRQEAPMPVQPCADLRDVTPSALASAAAAEPPKAQTALPVAAKPTGAPPREDRNTSASGTAQTSETLSRDRAFSRATQQSAASKAAGTSKPSWIHGGQKAPAGQCCDRCSLGLGKLKERGAALTCHVSTSTLVHSLAPQCIVRAFRTSKSDQVTLTSPNYLHL